MAVPYAYFRCPNCTEAIRFPFSSLEEKRERHRRLPTAEWLIHFLCRVCGLVSRRTAADVHLAHPYTEVPGPAYQNDSFYRVKHRCGVGGCEFQHVLYVHFRGCMTENEALNRTKRAAPRPFCEAGHPFDPEKELVSLTEVFSLL